MLQLKDLALILKTQAKVGLRPGRNWKKAYVSGDLYNSVGVTIKSSKNVFNYTLSIKSLFYGLFIQNGGNSISRYKAGPRPYNQAAVGSIEFKKGVMLYTKEQTQLMIMNEFKKLQRNFGK